MKQYLINVGISILITSIGLISFYNYAPFSINSLTDNGMVGSTITTILGSDTLKASRTIINDNFTALNDTKIENSTTTLPLITTLAGLTTAGLLNTIGTIVSGIWHGSIIDVLYGGTGWSNITSGALLYGNGANKLATTTVCADNEVIKYNGGIPICSSVTTDTSLNYNWSGYHTFANAGFTTATGTTLNFTGNATLGTLSASSLSFNTLATSTVAFGSFTATSSMVSQSWTQTITTGWTPRFIEINTYIQGVVGDSGDYQQYQGITVYDIGLNKVYTNYFLGEYGTDDGNLSLSKNGGYIAVMDKPGVSTLSVGSPGAGNAGFVTTVSVSATSTIGFTLSGQFTKSASASKGGRFYGTYKAYR